MKVPLIGGCLLMLTFGIYPPLRAQPPGERTVTIQGALLRTIGHSVIPVAAGTLLVDHEKAALDTVGRLMLGYGLIVGPSAGTLYAGDVTRAMIGIGIRVTSTAMTAGGIILIILAIDGDPHGHPGLGAALIVGGSVCTAASILWNVVTLPWSVEAHYRNTLTVTPGIDPVTRQLGLSVHLAM